jgi:NADH-quinone oxidoreductase subunit N
MTGIDIISLLRISPLLAITLLIFVLLAFDLFTRKRGAVAVTWLAAAGMALIAVGTLIFANRLASADLLWGGLLRMDMAAVALIALISTGAAVTLAFASAEPRLARHGEFSILLVSAALGLSLMAAAYDLISLYLAMELAGIPLYVLAGFLIREKTSTEAGLKYFLYGAMSSAVMLYGFSLLYGFSGSTAFPAIASAFTGGNQTLLLAVASLLAVVGFGYKIAAVPFHFWAPDVYEGAPSEVSGFLATVSKAAGFTVLLRFTVIILPALGLSAQVAISVLAVLSMLLGNILAMQQKNAKRLLAYSSIAHAGYLLVGVAAGTAQSTSAIFYYLTGYLFTNLAAFALVAAAARITGSEDIESFSGLSRRNPGMALMFLVAFLSLAGIPPFAGFAGKLLVFYSAAQAGLNWLVVVGVLNSVLALFYYLNVVKMIYARPAPETQPAFAAIGITGVKTGLTLCMAAIIYFGIFFLPWYDILAKAGLMLWN